MTGELLVAAEEGDVQVVAECLSLIQARRVPLEEEARLVDDADELGKTTMMAAARGAGEGGEGYAEILKMLWGCHQKCHTVKACLESKDTRHGWNVLMHAAKCGDPANLNVVLDMYRETFGSLSSVQDEIDWANVDRKVKQIIADEVFAGDAAPISNYGSRRRSRRGGGGDQRAPRQSKKSPVTGRRGGNSSADETPARSWTNNQGSTSAVAASAAVTPPASARRNEGLEARLRTSNALDDPQARPAAPTNDNSTRANTLNENDRGGAISTSSARTAAFKTDDDDDDDLFSQVTETPTYQGRDDLMRCQQELKRSQDETRRQAERSRRQAEELKRQSEEIERQADQIKRLKQALRAFTDD